MKNLKVFYYFVGPMALLMVCSPALAQVANTAAGQYALNSVTIGSYNLANGYAALYLNSSGNNNTANGTYALYNNTSGSYNTANGYGTLYNNTAANDNLAFGAFSMHSNTTGAYNTAVGFETLYNNTFAADNTAFGYKSLFANNGTSGDNGADNTAVGFIALMNNTTGARNTAVGSQALYSDVNGSGITAVGFQALYLNDGGQVNTAVGYQALYSNVLGEMNTAIGYQALTANTVNGNTANGYQALLTDSIGAYNTAVGSQAQFGNTTGGANAVFGAEAMAINSTGSANTAVGYNTLDTNNGSSNTAVGANALASNSFPTFSNNIAVGFDAGDNLTSGNYNIYIGNEGASSESGTIRIGTQGNQSTAFVAGIDGTTVTGAAVYVVAGTGQLGVQSSSQRFKKDIRDMGSDSEAILALRPVTYQYKDEIDPKGMRQFGLVAEEVEKVSPDLVIQDAKGQVFTVRCEAVNAMLLNEFRKQYHRVGDLARHSEEQDKVIATQQTEIAALKAQVEALAMSMEKK